MKTPATRVKALGELLRHERTATLERIAELRREQEEDVTPGPGDDLDKAKESADESVHVSLIDRAEERLKLVDEALARLERGRYGLCEDCGADIPVARLKLLPFAVRCVRCEERYERRGGGSGTIDVHSAIRWAPPEGMGGGDDEPSQQTALEEMLGVRMESPVGEEEGALEQPLLGRRPQKR